MNALYLIVHFVAAAALALLANHLGLIPWRRAAEAHWTERARLLWPVRFTASANVLRLPLTVFLLHRAIAPEIHLHWLAVIAAAFLGALIGCHPYERELFPELGFRSWWHHVLAGWGYRILFFGITAGAYACMPYGFDWTVAAIAGGYLVLHFWLQFGLLVRYLRWVGFLKPPDPRLTRIVEASAGQAAVPAPRTWLMEGVHAQAFALPMTQELLFSRRLLEICTEEEAQAVCAHEIAHLRESRATLAGRLVGSLWLFPLIFIKPLIAKFGLVGVLLPPLGVIGMIRFAHWLSLRMERRADEAATSQQASEGVYARALEKLYRHSHLPAVNTSKRSTHPHLYDRLLAAGITPEYPRPAAPRSSTWVGRLYVLAMVVALMWAAVVTSL